MSLLDKLFGINPTDYFLLPGNSYRGYSYPDTLVPFNITNFSSNFWKSTKLNKSSFKLTLRQFVDFRKMLSSGIAYDGTGKRLDKKFIEGYLNNLATDNTRCEWLDALFVRSSKHNDIVYHRFNDDNTLTEVIEPIESFLDEYRLFKFELDYWFNNATIHGLPQDSMKSMQPRTTYDQWEYIPPPHDKPTGIFSATYFFSGMGWAGLRCNINPDYTAPELGVRVARIKE